MRYKLPQLASTIMHNRTPSLPGLTEMGRFYGVSHSDRAAHQRIAAHLAQTCNDEPLLQTLFIELPYTLTDAFKSFTSHKDIERLRSAITQQRDVHDWSNIEVILKTAALHNIPIYPVDRYVSPEESEAIRSQPTNTGHLSPILKRRVEEGNATMAHNITTLVEAHNLKRFGVLAGAAHVGIAKELGLKIEINHATKEALRGVGINVDGTDSTHGIGL